MDLSERLIFRRDGQNDADGMALSRAAVRGTLVRLKRGAYLESSVWAELPRHRRHLALVLAFARSHPGAVFSHQSAAVLHGLPLIGALPPTVQVLAQRATGGRSEPGLHRRCLGFEDHEVTELQFSETWVRVTTVSRTLSDLAQVQPFAYAVAPLDFALREHMTSAEELVEALARRRPFRGAGRVERVLEFGDARAEFPGESLSRARIHELGFLAPDLQVRHRNPRGGHFRTDFEWVDIGQIGEFDGKGKYLKDEYTGGRPAGEVVYDEKLREDALRAEDKGVSRWGWPEAFGGKALRALLLRAGIPIVRAPIASRGRSEQARLFEHPRLFGTTARARQPRASRCQGG